MIALSLIGIGTGNPDHLTRAAEAAMRAADLILLPRKRAETAELLDLRATICAAVVGATARTATFDVPERDPGPPYLDGVEAWHDAIAAAWRDSIARHLPDGGRVALLVWGDPSLYDSSLRIAARLGAGAQRVTVGVVPGITSLQALAAAHAVPLTALGAPLLVTTGRRLAAEGWPAGVETVAVMLDSGCAFERLDPSGTMVWWGAYLGMAQQSLLAGPLAELAPTIRDERTLLRARHGWIMDCYLLRRDAAHAAASGR
ncbi:precorrin-6A synthase (deacetylating) [Sphingomonas sp. RHCKR7]|uniref:precorrin-6A synthase (deacetylating) n=1 Tax=Sphingomonas folli TaxID=2862497 RepID=UPI001CA483CF|nr:precorrin-6A synthase (deacetylating) [Sphingomonas folli]MBW6526096.1 precorrin-6A synthase (deacetylating) [Sphingomonas folli]